MTAQPQAIFRLSMTVGTGNAEAFAAAIEPFCDAVSWTLSDDNRDARVLGFAPGPPDAARVSEAVNAAAAGLGTAVPDFHIERIALKNWVLENLKDFPPVNAGRYFIHGVEYDEPPPAARIELCVPAGAAFGSGGHGSTLGCLLALDGLNAFAPGSALDMGCGSGILGLAIAKRWRIPVIAVDIDPKAVMTAARNFRRNRLHRLVRVIEATGYRAPLLAGRRFDLVVSNILARPLMRLAGELGRHLAPGGAAILSGLLDQDGGRVLAAHRCFGLRLERRLSIDGWLTLVLRK